MCAIIGFASSSPKDADWLLVGRDAMEHRGPDDAGVWRSPDKRVGLAHRRLAIIDLSPSGHQPMRDAAGSLTVVFNGEIYNYKDVKQELSAKGHSFCSNSDTEVILAAYREWGTDCVCRLNGMFAFALHDASCQALFIARDRAGEKPLFYSLSGGMLRFSSELKGLLADTAFPRRVDLEALDCYLAMGYVPGERCIVESVKKLPPAHALLFSLETGEAQVRRYWQLPPRSAGPADPQGQDLLCEMEMLLESSVRLQLVADVPVGILLSGGVDSSLVTAMAARASSNVKTFTVSFPGFGRYDESDHARLIARHFGTEHHELEAGNVGPELLPLLARQYDEPLMDSSMIPTYLVSKLVRQYCSVALGGDGGDELFGGYVHYDRLLWTLRNCGTLPAPVRKVLATQLGARLPTGFRGRNWLQALAYDLNKTLPVTATYFDAAERRKLLDGLQPRAPAFAELFFAGRIPCEPDLLQRATRMDFENYMVEDILVKVDRASMLNSLEIRAPLLDHRIIEFAFGKVPTSLKTTTSRRKILLKELCARLLPAEFDRQRKQGFSIPLAHWLRGGPWREFIYSVLLDDRCAFNREAVKLLLDGQDRGRANSERIFGLTLFELWRREYSMSF
jgi:asparagine synthase (glutamine-hydrolysing)